MKVDGLLYLAEVGVGVSQVAQVIAFAAPVADFLGNGECLLVKVDGLVYLAEVGVGESQIAQPFSFLALSPISWAMASACW